LQVWNEPNCGDLEPANGCCPECGPQDVYFELYKETALGIKEADPLVPVGGPATAMLAWIPEFTSWCAANGAPIDFVSSHLYPTDPQLPLSRDSFMNAVANASAQAAAAGLPFLLTEYNAGLGPPSDNHNFSMLDSSFTGAFLLHQHLLAQAVPNLKSMSFWTFTDFGFEENGVDPTPWNPGTSKFGIMNDEGVPKPSYRALQMISDAAGDATLPVVPTANAVGGGARNARVYVSTTDSNTAVGATEGVIDVSVTLADSVITALLASFNSTGAALPEAVTVTLTFRGLSAPLPTAGTLEVLDDAHANPMSTWIAAGSPTYSSPALIFSEFAASQLTPEPIALTAAGADAVSVTVVLQPYAVARVRISML